MKTLRDVVLCTHENAPQCDFYKFLVYKSRGMDLQLPTGHPSCPCDQCVWLNRSEDFFALNEGD